MLFNSFEFLLFLPIVFLLYWFVFRSRRWQNLLVVVASYVFYGWWDWRFLLLIALTTFCSFCSGLLIERYEGLRQRQKAVSIANIVLNLGILGLFKYYNFFVENLEALLGHAGWHIDWVTINIILPVGISFYTFQALSYSIDVYQKKIPATHDIVGFFAYISFFPQLVAGPIERATHLLPQFQRDRHFDYARAADGMRQMLWGFFKKLVIADNCASELNPLWDSYADFSGINIWGIALLFTFQIYCDFSGYSDIAIGCARLFGIDLRQNFNHPYLSRSIPEFWRRWHISLMSWFRDYVYFPLGGSRCSKVMVMRNTLIVFFLSGLWHGANWTFVCWGLYNALLIICYMLLGIDTKHQAILAQGRRLPSAKEGIQVAVTFCLVVTGWVIFRSENISQAFGFISRMFVTAFDDFHPRVATLYTIFNIMLLVVLEYVQRDKVHALQFPQNRFFSFRLVRWGAYAIIFTMIFLFTFTGNSQQFIYFQF